MLLKENVNKYVDSSWLHKPWMSQHTFLIKFESLKFKDVIFNYNS